MLNKISMFFIRLINCVIPNKKLRKKIRNNFAAKIERKELLTKIKNTCNEDTFFCIGDSHVDVFSENTYPEKISLAPELFKTIFTGNIHSAPEFVSYHLDGVLAYSLSRRGTTNQGVEKIEWLKTHGFLPKNCRLITIFGEPDCRTHIEKQAKRQNKEISEIVDNVIENYGKFLLKMKDEGHKIYVYSPIASQKGEMEIDPIFKRFNSELERNKILILFEEKMKKFCDENNLHFVSILHELLDENLVTKGEYYVKDGVHLNDKGRILIMNAII